MKEAPSPTNRSSAVLRLVIPLIAYPYVVVSIAVAGTNGLDRCEDPWTGATVAKLVALMIAAGLVVLRINRPKKAGRAVFIASALLTTVILGVLAPNLFTGQHCSGLSAVDRDLPQALLIPQQSDNLICRTIAADHEARSL